MRLSDIMSQMGLASYAEAALLLFFFTFLAVSARVWRTSKEASFQHAHIPFEDSPQRPSSRS
jgi:cbb3-type cytochrome oxidase subunit 3